ncbi:SnoaL-like domain-containing protein [Dyadobacter koreensis]|uniref:SnoaL-like domain-containing protein n=1 Tax=Dyadobacter koreensis TaxID=408657 RepID=A0A1H6YDB1_9BACT|nr:nuclear transport factor 2 family protein [Dyadobacter koreensis]SEJ39258.1 SnoaL-like domain-containing protein [Dyadobacter koreensis]
MTKENVRIKEELRNLIDAYALLSDEKKIADVVHLFTEDTVYESYINGTSAGKVSGRKEMEKVFNGHASFVKTYFTLNGQHIVQIDEDTATGISFAQIKMIREPEGKSVLSDYSVRYDDKYVCQDGRWLIKERSGYFILIEERVLRG